MTSTTRLLSFVFLAALAAVLTACPATNSVQECGASGKLCPQGFHCAAAEGVCLPDTNTCGDAKVDDGEKCDDGNTIDTDGCNSACSSTNACGNKIVDSNVGEVCDDGGTVDGDVVDGKKCSRDCKSLEVCGNKIVDLGEVCDDGNDVVGDGCSQSCQSLEVCGNNKLDPGEACEPPNTASCSADCTSTLSCSNGNVDPGEECDVFDGTGRSLNADNADCRADCVVARCGDGRVNSVGSPGHLENVEQCDPVTTPTAAGSRDANPIDTQACNIDCTTPSCGDKKVNRAFTPIGAAGPEQCDDGDPSTGGANADTAACTASCQVNVCGDHLTHTGVEQCDDGDRNDTNACTNACRTAACGDGILRAGVEQCDDDNEDSGDGCSATCVKEFCGDGTTNNVNEECDSGGIARSDCNANCRRPTCGDNIVNPQFTPAGAAGVEQCDPPSVANGCSATCRFEQCGNGVTDPGEDCDDGPGDARGNGCFACRFERCGNGILDQGEECDDSNNVATDLCVSNSLVTTTCKTARCGDGHILAGVEQCDNGAANGQPGNPCSVSCRLATCGNGVLEQDEECDDGNAADNDDCVSSNPAPASCKIARCGDGKENTTGRLAAREQCDLGDTLPGDGCSATCQLEQCGNSVIDPDEECDNGAGNNLNSADCRADCLLNRCGDGHINASLDTLGDPKEDCDGGPLAAAGSLAVTPTETATCNINCTTALCGDGIVNDAFTAVGGTKPEECDPPTAPGGGCSSVCQFEQCGNGIQDFGEACDNGLANANTGLCKTDCELARCGDGLIRTAGPSPETCEPGVGPGLTQAECPYALDDAACTVCNATTCVTESADAPFCGDGLVFAAEEVCDDANRTCGSCGNNCKVVTSAKATGLIFAGTGIVEDDTLTINDGVGTTVTFTFVDDSPGAGEIKIESVAQTAQNIANAINGSGVQILAATLPGTGFVTLTHRQATTLGNGGDGVGGNPPARITSDIAIGVLAIIDMSGGQGGDCALGLACKADNDCASGNCDDGLCAAPTP